MKKLIMILALITAPFLSLANIFTDGTVDTRAPKVNQEYSCISRIGDIQSFNSPTIEGCGSVGLANFPSTIQGKFVQNVAFSHVDGVKVFASYEVCTLQGSVSCYEWSTGQVILVGEAGDPINVYSCPPDDFLSFTYPIDNDADDNPDACADPQQISLNDSCSVSSGNSVLNVAVTQAQGCYTQPDGSVCAYNAVDVGGGNQVYELDYEASCYGDNPYPSLDDNSDIGQLPTSSECTNNGGLLACPADPSDVCTNGQCQEGCGYVNDQFVCYDIDTDLDGLPDYNDPDVDGDGIANGDDLDADGDGQDDPINGGNGNQSGGGSTVNVDMSGVEAKLQSIDDELKKSLTIPEKGSFDIAAAQTSLEEKQTEYSTLLNTIKSEASSIVPQLGTGSGSFSSCHKLIQVNGKTEERCLDTYSDEMSVVSIAIFFLFTVAGGFVVLRGVTKSD